MPPAVRCKTGNLPFELTSFVGRRREIAYAKQQLAKSRLVTLTGIGGVGKTRTALRVAADARRAFDGLWLIELGELQNSAMIADAVVTDLGLYEQSPTAALPLLIKHLADQRFLLVLDNCEHLVDAAAEFAETLLRNCAELRILATSREPLGIGGEVVLRIPPLAVPGTGHAPSLQGLPGYDAITLFAERAVAEVPEFGLTEQNRVAITQICQRLDGLPLPIELAAARLRVMSAEQILQRLSDRYQILTAGTRRAPTRQQTLRLCIDWSYALCSVAERDMWGRLSVFAGSFELDAAESICASETAPETTLDVVASLIDKSILIREEVGRSVRYRLLDTLRDYGREKLQKAADHEPLQRKHRDWYRQLVLRAEAEWIGPQQVEWIARLTRELPNLRDAIGFCLAVPGEEAAALEISAALYPFWFCRGLLTEGQRWLDQSLNLHDGKPTVDLAKALCADSVLADRQGNLPKAASLLDSLRGIAEDTGDTDICGFVAYTAGQLALHQSDHRQAVEAFENALAAFHADQNGLLFRIGALQGLGLARCLLGDFTRAAACHAEILAVTEPRQEQVYRIYALWALGLAWWRSGDTARGADLLKQSLRILRVVDDPLASAWCLEGLAWIAAGERRAQRAAVLMGAAHSRWNAVGSPSVHLPGMVVFHKQCERQSRSALGDRAFAASFRRGARAICADAVTYAIDEHVHAPTDSPRNRISLTKREREVAGLIAQGLTNKAIAGELVIAQRTAQGHVEHVLAKLGFTSRAQIAAWVVEQGKSQRP
ncbi:LuxR family transcriptional regulator [Rhodococcus koreensis]|nr:LuxR family transcriptional regulator [Rhodococcus koreensis]